MRLAYVVRSLKPMDVAVLKALMRASESYRYVPFDALQRALDMSAIALEKRLRYLHRLGLIRRWSGQYRGFELKTIGLDAIALYELTSRGVIKALGPKLGVGKESDVYEALDSDGGRVAVKLLRAGTKSFKHVRRARVYKVGRRGQLRFKGAIIAARREYEALRLLHPRGLAVPMPIARSRHAIVMSVIEGDPLYVCDVLPDPEALLREIVDNAIAAYREAGVVHGELSEYNVIVTPSIHPLIIDWPQWVPSTHPLARDALIRDLERIATFFRRRFGVSTSIDSLAEGAY
ncbi:serine/threonine protein kinase [Candidatus Geothermarchaeota archaeon ex4572_27]|nr:MAG: serine/threonine protein kinase [Candidatus Geothermarchaeota archaeon ex4572_27]